MTGWYRRLYVRDIHLCVSVGLLWRFIQIPLSFLLLKIFRNGVSFLLSSIVNCLEDLSQIKGALSGLRQFLATESPSRTIRNSFYFTSKALSFLKIFKFLSWLFGHVAKRLDKKDQVNFKFYNVTAWLTNNCPIHIQYTFCPIFQEVSIRPWNLVN